MIADQRDRKRDRETRSRREREILGCTLRFTGPGTNGALYDWRTDRELLEKGPFSFRIEEKEREDLRRWITDDFWSLLTEDQ